MSDHVNPYEAPFYYSAKASRSERDRGCEGLYWKYDNTGTPIQIAEDEYHELEAAGERVAESNVHPTVKPVGVMEWLINRLTEPGDVVLDPFAGSGTTGIAAIKAERDAQLIELNADESYEPIIRGRLKAAKYAYLDELEVWRKRPKISVPGDEDEDVDENKSVRFDKLFG